MNGIAVLWATNGVCTNGTAPTSVERDPAGEDIEVLKC
jgi:hypothetical protein